MRGDLDGDGEITMMDVRVLRQYLDELIELTETQKKAADVDGDGEITMMDVRWLRQYLDELRDENFNWIGF